MIVIDIPNCFFFNIKSLCKNPKHEKLRKGVIDVVIMSDFVWDRALVTVEDPTYGWVKLHNSMHNREHGIFRHYEVPVRVKKYKWFENEVI